MAEMIYLVRYYCNGMYYRERVPEYDLAWVKRGLERQQNCAFISETQLGVDPNIEAPMYFNCVPYIAPGKNAEVDNPTERTRIEQIREKSPEELAEFLLDCLTQIGVSSNEQCRTQMVEWLQSTGSLRMKVLDDLPALGCFDCEGHEGREMIVDEDECCGNFKDA